MVSEENKKKLRELIEKVLNRQKEASKIKRAPDDDPDLLKALEGMAREERFGEVEKKDDSGEKKV